MWELLLLLLPMAAASGWAMGRRQSSNAPIHAQRSLSSEYFQGLNYVLNEQPDKAIEVFVRMIEVDSETVETHLALGNLFRRRGEVDRAIRIHQNIFTKPNLSREQRTQALLELGQDYMRAGLLDRAESLFLELTEMDAHSVPALRLLVDIYQQEKDWERAIAIQQKVGQLTARPVHQVIAHYHCELAERAVHKGQQEQARALLTRAMECDARCVRASLVEGELAARVGDHRAAIAAYQRVEAQDPDFLVEVVEPLQASYRALDALEEMRDYFAGLLDRHHCVSLVLTNAELVRSCEGDIAAMKFLAEHLHRHPSVRGTKRLLELNLDYFESDIRERLEVLNELAARLLADKPAYKCCHCGFTGKSLHWQCPSCKNWSSVRPIQGVEGE